MTRFQDIDATELYQMLNQADVLLVDVRNQEEVNRGIIAEALHIPLSLLPVEYDKLGQAQHVVFYCHSGIRSALAADFALSKGIKNVYNLQGGILAWSHAGYDLTHL